VTEKEKREFLRDLLVFREHIRKSKQKKKKSIPQKEIETRIKN